MLCDVIKCGVAWCGVRRVCACVVRWVDAVWCVDVYVAHIHGGKERSPLLSLSAALSDSPYLHIVLPLLRAQ
jgi:hypothetical protein